MKQQLEQNLKENWKTLRALAQSIIKDPTIADDVLQTAFLKALTTKSTPKNDSKTLPWLKTIIKNTALDILRKQKRQTQHQIDKDIDTILHNNDFKESICNCIITLLPKLSKSDQSLIQNLDLEEKSLQELSQTLSITKNALKVRHHRARKRLKEILINACKTGTQKECNDCRCD